MKRTSMHQPFDYEPTPLTLDVDGHVDSRGVDGHVDSRGVRYIGTAHRQPNGKYVALADVGGALCRVECTITFSSSHQL